MKKLIILGTGAACVTKCYNTCFAIYDGDEYFLVDGGGGTFILNRLEDKNIDINKIKNVFVTHSHTDHILGIIWIIRIVSQKIAHGGYEGDLNVYAHIELIQKIRKICELVLPGKYIDLFDRRIKFLEVKDSEEKRIMDMNFTFFDTYSRKEKQFGFVLNTEGQKILFSGDEPLKEENAEKYLRGADWFFTEAFCRYEDREIFKPYEKKHSTVKEPAQLAQEYEIKNLLLWHTEDKTIKTRKKLYTEEAQLYFGGKVYVPDDLEEIDLC